MRIMGVRLDCLQREHVMGFRPRKWIDFDLMTPVWGLVAIDDEDGVIAMGGFLDGFPWGKEIWIATSDKAGKHALSLYKTFKSVLSVWLTVMQEPMFTTTSHEMSHKMVRRLGFRIVEETPTGAVRWKRVSE
jgi:hypothetical protein